MSQRGVKQSPKHKRTIKGPPVWPPETRVHTRGHKIKITTLWWGSCLNWKLPLAQPSLRNSGTRLVSRVVSIFMIFHVVFCCDFNMLPTLLLLLVGRALFIITWNEKNMPKGCVQLVPPPPSTLLRKSASLCF